MAPLTSNVCLEPASSMFLFDPQRTGRLKHCIGPSAPRLVWSYELPSYLPRAPESSPVFDGAGNVYFGAHDGLFYSLDASGRLRWFFNTLGAKVYSSPTLDSAGRVFFCGSNNVLFCLNATTGRVVWTASIGGKSERSLIGKVLRGLSLLKYDYRFGQRLSARCWCSPLVQGNLVVVSGRGTATYAYDAASGNIRWAHPLGFPYNHQSSAAANAEGLIFAAAQRSRFFAINVAGETVWSVTRRNDGDSIATPSVDEVQRQVYFPINHGFARGSIFAVGFDGRLKWKMAFDTGFRGSAALSPSGDLILAGSAGQLLKLCPRTGRTAATVNIANPPPPYGLWTTPAIDPNGRILVALAEKGQRGGLICLSADFQELWRLPAGKCFGTPVLDRNQRLYFGSWAGDFSCYTTEQFSAQGGNNARSIQE